MSALNSRQNSIATPYDPAGIQSLRTSTSSLPIQDIPPTQSQQQPISTPAPSYFPPQDTFLGNAGVGLMTAPNGGSAGASGGYEKRRSVMSVDDDFVYDPYDVPESMASLFSGLVTPLLLYLHFACTDWCCACHIF